MTKHQHALEKAKYGVFYECAEKTKEIMKNPNELLLFFIDILDAVGDDADTSFLMEYVLSPWVANGEEVIYDIADGWMCFYEDSAKHYNYIRKIAVAFANGADNNMFNDSAYERFARGFEWLFSIGELFRRYEQSQEK